MEEQLRMPGLWNDFDEQKAQFTQRTTLAALAKCSGKRVALDTETTGLRWWDNHMIGLGVWCPDADVYGYIPSLEPSTRQQIQQVIQGWDRSTIIIMHNAKFDWHFLGVDPSRFDQLIDTTVLVHLFDSRLFKRLTDAEKIFLGTNSKRSHLLEAPKRKKIWEWPIPVVADYCVNDTLVTYQLAQILVPQLVELQLWSLLKQQMNFLKVVWAAERRGLYLDTEFIEKAVVKFTADVEQAEKELYKEIGYEFNWRSPKVLSKALYDDYGWERPVNPFADADGVDRTRFAHKGKYNKTLTDSFILMEKAEHPLGHLILHLREAYKMRNYLSNPSRQTGYLELADQEPAIHANFNLAGTRTGRLSCRAPNLQNIPADIRVRETQAVYSADTLHRIEEYNLRLAFPCRPGHKMVSIDYKQMEMRMFGILAQEPKMVQSLLSGRDIHADVAEMIWGTRDDVHREWSKTIGFGLIYGMTLGSVQFRLNMDKTQAHEVVNQYWSTFPRIKPWLGEMIQECMDNKYVRYWSGRIWREENPDDMFKGANAVIQGGSADVLSLASIRCHKYLQETGYGAIVSFVHDEMLFEIREECVEKAIPELSRIMEVPDLFEVPFFTSTKVGNSYGSLEKIEAENG